MARIWTLVNKLILVLAFLWINNLTGQELSKEELFEISFDSLAAIEFEIDYGTPYLKEVLEVHIERAKAQKDSIELFNAYMESAWNGPFEDGLLYCDSMINISQNLGDNDLLSRSHYVKGAIYYESNFPEQSLDQLINCYNYARASDNPEYQVDALNLIAALKREYGEQEEAIILQNLSLELLSSNKDRIDYYDETYLITLDNIARCYAQIKNIDSARYFTRKGMQLALDLDDHETFKDLSILDAQINYYDDNLIKSRDTLIKYKDSTFGTSQADLLFYLSELEERLGNREEKIEYLKNIHAILSDQDYPLMDNVKEVYQDLLQNALENNRESQEQIYLKRLFYYDSLITITETKLKDVALKKFDIPFQEQRLKESQVEISKKERTLLVLYVAIALIGIGFLVLYFRHQKMKRKFQSVMKEEVKPISRAPAGIESKQINIDERVVRNTLDQLEKWEEEKGFLNRNISQNSLASLLDTNSTYLSKIINTYKKQNFSNYLKDLRITYAINYLKQNPQVVKSKSMIQLAEQFGFNSIDVFNRAFKAKIGLTPAMFIKQIKKSNL